MRIWQTHRIVVAACPVTVIAKPPLVVSAVAVTAHVVAPASAYKDVTVAAPTIAVDAALAPLLITPSIYQPFVSPAPVTPAIHSPRK